MPYVVSIFISALFFGFWMNFLFLQYPAQTHKETSDRVIESREKNISSKQKKIDGWMDGWMVGLSNLLFLILVFFSIISIHGLFFLQWILSFFFAKENILYKPTKKCINIIQQSDDETNK